MEDKTKIRASNKRRLSLPARAFLVFGGLMILCQGCAELGKYVGESQREQKLKQQMRLAEEELRRGNLVSAQTLFEWVCKESKRPSVQGRAMFFTGFCTLLDKKDTGRWEGAQGIFVGVSQRFPDAEFGEISGYIATALLDVLSAMEASEKDIVSMRQRIDLERSHRGEMDRLVQKQKEELSEKTDEIAALKRVLQIKDKEIESLRLKMEKLEEIHKEIKRKRKSLT